MQQLFSFLWMVVGVVAAFGVGTAFDRYIQKKGRNNKTSKVLFAVVVINYALLLGIGLYAIIVIF